MSLCPYFFNEMVNELSRPTIFDQHFGIGIPTSDLLSLPMRTGYLRPWRNLNQQNSGVASLVQDKDGLKINLDVQQFKPEELNVKVTDDFIVVEGKHEERSDEHGFISRQFTRRYKLPKNVNVNCLESKLSSDGVLQLYAPKLAPANSGERNIPITHTNQPAIKQQAAQSKEDNKEKPSQ